jgi:hypothetical protein
MLSDDGVSQDELRRFLLLAQEMFLGHDLNALSAHFVLPCVVYSAAGILLIKDEDGFRDHTSRYFSALSAENIRMSECTIADIVKVSDQRFHATVRWMDIGDDGRVCSTSLVRYFMIEDGSGQWKIEMMEFVEMPITLSQAEYVIH